jgi:hypothetical protein
VFYLLLTNCHIPVLIGELKLHNKEIEMKKLLMMASILGFITSSAYAQSREKDEIMFGFGADITQSTKFGFGYGVTFNIQKLDTDSDYDMLVQLRYTRFTPNLFYGQDKRDLDNPDVTFVGLEESVVDEINEFGLTVGLPVSERHGRKQIYWFFDFSAGSLRGTHVDFKRRAEIIEPETGYILGAGTGPMFRIQLVENQLTLNSKLTGEIGALKLRQYSYGHWDTYFSARVTISIIWAF